MKRLTILLLLVLSLAACTTGGEDDAPETTIDAPSVTDPNAIRSDLPEDFPVPVPDGADVQTAARQEAGEGQFTYGALVKFEDGRYDELVDFYDDFAADLEGVERIVTSTERDGVTWRNSETGLLITISQAVESVTLAVTVPPGAL